MRLRWVLPIWKHEAYLRFMKSVNNALGFAASDIAQFRFRCLEILEKQGFAGVKLAFPQVSRRSVFRWQERYRRSGKRSTSLIPLSTRPSRCRQMVVPAPVLGFIKAVRQQHPKLSKYKLKVFLDVFCREKGFPLFSVSWIGKVIKRQALFFNTRIPVKKSRKSHEQKLRIWRCPKQTEVRLGYLQIDGLKVVYLGRTLYFLCAVELKSRQAWARRVGSLSSLQAKIFLEGIIAQADYPIHTVQTDNGSEFARYFEQALKEIGLIHLWSPPHSPKVNGYVERFNGIIQEEFIDYHIDIGVIDKIRFDQLLKNWLVYYNGQRPHHGLNLKTPLQYLQEQQILKTSQSAKCV